MFSNCLNVFPCKLEEYKKDKIYYKNLLMKPMQKLKKKLQNKETLKALLEKSFFNAGEVSYLTIKNGDSFYVFHNNDVVKTLTENISVENSNGGQKVIFKIKNANPKTLSRFPLVTIGEIEMRNDSEAHFKEIKFWMGKDKTFELLNKIISPIKKVKPRLILCGKSLKIFRKY